VAGEDDALMPPWKHRRRLIYASFFLGGGMIGFGAVTYLTDTQVASQLVIGGVALISIIISAYTAAATFEDVRLWKQEENDGEG
jgi:polyferredoxin